MTISLRPATAADADALAEVVGEGFESYRSFAPPGWEPPDRLELALGLVMRLPDPGWWCLVAEEGGVVVGQAAIMPAERHRRPDTDPALAHLLQLFVRRALWGTGLAVRLHAGALEEAARRGFTAIRLFTPADHARARRFYEREGWSAPADGVADSLAGLPIIELRRPLGGSGSRASA